MASQTARAVGIHQDGARPTVGQDGLAAVVEEHAGRHQGAAAYADRPGAVRGHPTG